MTRLAFGLVAVALVAGCGQAADHGSRKAAPTGVITPAPTSTVPARGAAPAAGTATGTSRVDADLKSVDAALSQVDSDLSAGDSARAQNDDN